ncbi:hypothetical protein BOTBODRAFT_39729 [Botryobasidium botryosum FD-172 SS1]|uniref:Sacsin/Nov domain-containing protein n=1 Tax=Botryobasidium botryosum (strain FD-172 SS1) TaxID=930990 RepID=A0A067LSK1_BOTB1|nr:hypothetical protein BOTBODRAFT_39729 [Botryobasidium botryosum FD-172 SS1]
MHRTELWEGKANEPIKINQRALIDKVLARYSGEFIVFRELLQNADDGNAKHVKIHFKTKKYMARNESKEATGQLEGQPELDTREVSQWTIQDDGKGFEEVDRDRLKSIADGNPNEQKIGAFGVGFYSVFSITDEPVVTSVDPKDGKRHGMAFNWVQDQLFVCCGTLPSRASKSTSGNYMARTKIKMILRKLAPLPSHPTEITRFLGTSLAFANHLHDISVYLDGHCFAHVTKENGVQKELGHPGGGLQSVFPERMMTVTGIKSTDVYIKASVMRSLCKTGTREALVRSLETSQDPKEMVAFSIRFTVFAASIGVQVDGRMTEELERATKKKPPTHSTYQLLYMGKAEYDMDSNDQGTTSTHWNIFQGLRVGLDSAGAARIFIGHATTQTTGICGHAAARFIPTVERALIELVDETHHETVVSRWNKELLFVGGYLTWAVYEYLIDNIKTDWETPPEANSDVKIRHAKLRQEFVHILRFFTFHPSTPSPAVSSLAEDAFFSCASSSYFAVVSTIGIKDAREVRLYDSALAGFIRERPTLSMDVTEAMTTSLRARGFVPKFSFADVVQELESRPLTPSELMECLNWWKNLDAGTRDHSRRKQLLSAVKFYAFSLNAQGKQTHTADTVILLESIRTFVDPPNNFPLDLPLPPHTLPAIAGQSLNLSALGPDLGWSALTVVEWVENLTSKSTLGSASAESNLMTCELFATQILWFIAQVWNSPTVVEQHHKIANKLKEVPCIPTQSGMKRPEEAYLQTSIFPDLPVVYLPKGEAPPSMNGMLLALGVRQGVELQLVWDRMVNTRCWSNSQLVQYLVQNKHALTLAERQRLKEAPVFVQEEPNGERAQRSSFLKMAPISMQDPEHVTASQLYEPTETLRQLDLPILDWSTNSKWQTNSDEANLLFELGLNRRPGIHDLLERAACSYPALSKVAFRYFMNNFLSYAPLYEATRFSKISFVPSIRPDGSPCLAKPSEVFIDSDSSIVGFLVVNPSFRPELLAHSNELQLKGQPPIEAIIARLLSRPPNDHENAKQIFSYLDKRKDDFTPAEFTQLRGARIIPVRDHSDASEGTVCLKAVHECYAGKPRVEFHSRLFTFISGFDGAAKAFLRACGIKEEPTVPEIIQKIISNPQKFYESAGGTDEYLAELQNIAREWVQVEGFLQEEMKRSPMFLGRQAVGTLPHGISQDSRYILLHPEKIVIIDDEHAYGLFSDCLHGAPQETIIEELYFALGSPRLGTLIREKPEFQGKMLESSMAKRTHTLILERLPLFLRKYRSVHQQPLITIEELSQDCNFLVKTVAKLQLVKVLDSQDLEVERKSEASAAGFREKGGLIQLLLARNIPLDMYEVAHSMCKVIFYRHRASDSSLLAGILSADIDALKRRGYNVDALLSPQKILQRASRAANAGTRLPGAGYFARNSSEPRVPLPGVPAKKSPIQPLSFLRKFKRSHSQPSSSPSPLGLLNSASITHPQRMRLIDDSIDAALKCEGGRVPLSSTLLSQSPHLGTTQGSLGGAVYCGTDNRHEGFTPSGEVNGYQFHVERSLRNSAQLITEKKDPLHRFTTRVINPLREIYELPITHIQIIYTADTRLMAFNRNQNIFLNLYYYEISHDEKVMRGTPNTALISWYFTFAHEIAHNLVEEHNADHEYIFSHICGRFFPAFTNLITPPEGTQADIDAEGPIVAQI